MQYDHEKLCILDPLIAKLIDLNLFTVTIAEGEKDLQKWTTLYFLGGQWIRIHDNGTFETSSEQFHNIIVRFFQEGMLEPAPVTLPVNGQLETFQLHTVR